MRKKWLDLYPPTSPADVTEGSVGEVFTSTAASKVTVNPILETNLDADNPDKAAKLKASQDADDAAKKIKEEQEAIIKSMKENMTKYNNALNDTFEEIMDGTSKKKDEGK
jgi:hypothetical protein